MKSKSGYREQKTQSNTGNWLKWYFDKKTCRLANKVAIQWNSRQTEDIEEWADRLSNHACKLTD